MGRAKKTDPSTFEKLGAFYLGKRFDHATDDIVDELVLYDAKDLTTHGVCVGMTGSGKTGLCVSILEEAALDGVPVIAIDPKGDISNVLLTFPKLRAEDFRPWIDEGTASRKGKTPDEFAKSTADLWRKGLAKWGQDGKRIKRFREAAEAIVYTPGSSAGVPLAVLRSFAAPAKALVEDTDAMRERVSASVSGLLGLIGIDADPIQSREHILLSQLVDRAWRNGKDLDIGAMIAQVQSPPFEKIGVMSLDTFFPEKARFELSMRLNSLLASPGFSAWLEGAPLDIPKMLWTESGKPRIAIVSIAHLSDKERMFFVTLLLNEIVAWMRTQSGTSSLRAILYMDEVFGYLPPTANPPSKMPLLTMLKQARAYGLGVLLATQNPVDLDYKALSNAGTWFLGRLQTERDKLRVLDGLEGASTASGQQFNRRAVEATLSGLKSRVFLMNNVHEEEPVLFHTRWAMSYLRGPLTRGQIGALMAGKVAAVQTPATALAPPVATEDAVETDRPIGPAGTPVRYVAPSAPFDGAMVYWPGLVGTADLHYVNARAGLDEWRTISILVRLEGDAMGQVWAGAAEVLSDALVDEAEPEARFAVLPKRARQAKTLKTWSRQFKTYLYQERSLTLFKCKELKIISSAQESEAQFKVRVREATREKRDLAVEKLRKRYASKFATLRDRIQRAEEKVDRERAQLGQQKLQTTFSVGATVLGAFLGRRGTRSSVARATTAMRGAGRVAKEKQDVARAQERLGELEEQFADMEIAFDDEVTTLETSLGADAYDIVEFIVRPRKSDINIDELAIAWIPSPVKAVSMS